MALPKQNRLRSSRDFGKVYRQGKRASTSHLAIRALKRVGRLSNGQANSIKQAGSSEQAVDRSLDQALDRSVGRGSAGDYLPALSSCFGISISKKVSKRAVVRNRIKRQLHAIIRDRLSDIDSSWQVVIVVRPSAVECEFTDFLRELEYLLKKLNVLSSPKE